MNVFLSYSGPISQQLAEKLRTWIPCVVASAKPWVASHDIEKGHIWAEKLYNALKQAHVAILCVTRENSSKPWLNFEAGVIAHRFSSADYVCPYLLDLTPSELPSPLAQFQTTVAAEKETKKLVQTIAKAVNSDAELETLNAQFEKWWPELRDFLIELRAQAEGSLKINTKYDLFVSAPMTALKYANVDYEEVRAVVVEAIDYIENLKNSNLIYSALKRVIHLADVEPSKLAFNRDMDALRHSKNYLLIYPSPCPTSAIYEAGYAYALRKPSVYLVQENVNPPFVLEGAALHDSGQISILKYTDKEHMLKILSKYLDDIFSLSSLVKTKE